MNVSLRGALFAASIIANALLSALLFLPNLRHATPENTAKLAPATAFAFMPNSFSIRHTVLPTPTPVPAPVFPVRLTIQKIHVDAAVEQVGLTPTGAMGAPKERSNVAWFNLGSSPGERGSAVIAGHYGWKDAKASAFDNLYKLRKGDTVSVQDNTGATVLFVVHDIRRYEPTATPEDVFSSSDGKAHLNLVTCEGTWNAATKSYSRRLVIFTDKQDH